MNFGMFLLLIVPTIIVALAAKLFFKHSISWKEFGIQVGVCVVVVGMFFGLSLASLSLDTQILSGSITKKEKVWTSCEHSYDCNCYTTCSTDSNGNESCTEHCSTCYDHANDWDWTVYNSLGGSVDIDRIDRRGSDEPPRFTAVKIGEPYAETDTYQNYIKAAPESIFNFTHVKIDQFANMIPQYPTVYDYYRINRVISVGVPIKDLPVWNEYLSNKMRTIGAKKQANINVILVNTPDQTYRYALEAAWIGGKKNDVTVIIGMTKPNTIDWVDTITFGNNAGNSLMTVLMRDRLMDVKEFNYSTVIDVISSTVVEKFDRKPMSDFEYLKSNIVPSDGAIIFCLIMGLILSIGCSIVMHKNEI